MTGLAAILLSYLLAYKYPAVALVVFISAVAIPLPASTVLLAAGAFAGLGFFSFPIMVAVAVAANVAGDIFDFLLARHYRELALGLLPSTEAPFVVRIRRSIDEYAGLTIFLTRFAGGVPGNILAGFADVPFSQFFLFAFLGDLIQVGGVLYLGYLGGDYWQDLLSVVSVTGSIIGIFLLLVALVAIFYAGRKGKR